MELVAVVQLSLEPDWFHLPFEERQNLRREVFHILNSNEQIRCRWFDSEPWTGTVAEFFVCEFSELPAYWNFWNELREHSVFRHPYLRIGRVSLGYERPLTIGLVDT